MKKKHLIRLTEEEREICRQVIKNRKGAGQKARRAQILLKADANGPAWTDQQIAEAIPCRTKTVENIRQRYAREGFEKALERKQRMTPATERILNSEQEAKLIAMRMGPPPRGYYKWTLRLLAQKVVELGIAESISHETVRQTLIRNGLTKQKIES